MIVYQSYRQDGSYMGGTPVQMQAVNAAKTEAVKTGNPVDVVQVRIDDGRLRRVRYHPDGSVERLWEEEKNSDISGAAELGQKGPGSGEGQVARNAGQGHRRRSQKPG